MGKVDFRSHTVELAVPVEKAFLFLSDLNNMKELMPEQIINWQSAADSCAFDIKGMAHVTLTRAETIENKMVRIVSGPDTPLDLEITGNLERINDSKTSAWISLTADLSPILKLMASGPLQNLVNIMAEKLKDRLQSDG
jgi:carbon monoxide dehydrogenase subunit G